MGGIDAGIDWISEFNSTEPEIAHAHHSPPIITAGESADYLSLKYFLPVPFAPTLSFVISGIFSVCVLIHTFLIISIIQASIIKISYVLLLLFIWNQWENDDQGAFDCLVKEEKILSAFHRLILFFASIDVPGRDNFRPRAVSRGTKGSGFQALTAA